jgi:hypothetical protein
MRDSMVPAALVFAALALMLGFTPRKLAAAATALAILAAVLASRLQWQSAYGDAAVLACSVVVAILAVRTYWPRPTDAAAVLFLAALAGVVSGISIALAATPANLWQPILPSVLLVPAWLAVRHGYAVAPRVVMSWLLAVAVLAAILPYVVSHPGYVADHHS